MDTNDAIRIKRFLKNGIQAKILSKRQVMMLKPEHLQGVTGLEDIDLKTIEKTLKHVKSKLQPTSVPKRKNDIGEHTITRLIKEKAGSHLDEVKKIFALSSDY